MTEATNLSQTRAEFIEKIGLITQAEGLPRIAGRVFGLLIFDGEAVSFGELASSLQVSRGSISGSIKLLEERGLIKRVAKAGDRQDYFQLASNPYATLLEGVQKRTRAARAEVQDTIDALPQNAEAKARLQAYAEFYGSLDTAAGNAITDLNSKQNT